MAELMSRVAQLYSLGASLVPKAATGTVSPSPSQLIFNLQSTAMHTFITRSPAPFYMHFNYFTGKLQLCFSALPILFTALKPLLIKVRHRDQLGLNFANCHKARLVRISKNNSEKHSTGNVISRIGFFVLTL